MQVRGHVGALSPLRCRGRQLLPSRRDFALRALTQRQEQVRNSVSDTPKSDAVRPLRWVALLGLLAGFCLLTLGAHPASAAEGLDSSTEQAAPESVTTTTVVADASTDQSDTASTTEEAATSPTTVAPMPDQATPVSPSMLLTGSPSNTGSGDGAAPIVIVRRSDQKAAAKAAGDPVIESNILSSALPSSDSVSTTEAVQRHPDGWRRHHVGDHQPWSARRPTPAASPTQRCGPRCPTPPTVSQPPSFSPAARRAAPVRAA